MRLRVKLAGALAVTAAAAVLAAPPVAAMAPGAPAAPGPVICGQPILNSPWNYAGGATTFTSGQFAGLPTFGSAGTNFPSATSGIIVPAGNNTTAANAGTYQVNNAVVYFEPGTHLIEAVAPAGSAMYTGHNSAYVGGYTAGAGKAVINGVDGATGGTGHGGAELSASTASSGVNVYDTWEYLTIENYTSSLGNSLMGNSSGGAFENGDTYKYDTIGPNTYAYTGSGTAPATGQNSGGGYAINAGSYTTIEYNCLTQNSEGAFNSVAPLDLVVANNEISQNGLGEYPDLAGSGPNVSPFSCGCSGGGKVFFSLNSDVVNNYVHDNYNAGIWYDFDNAGGDFSHNYIASNWGVGLMLEASYNASISDNTLTGNGWASDGAWPAGDGGDVCSTGPPTVSCTAGLGANTGSGGGNPYGAIDLSDSGGNATANAVTVSVPAGITVPGCASSCTAQTRYAGHLYVRGNSLVNNFGGVKVYYDTGRFPGNISNDSPCDQPFGALRQPNSVTYYQQTQELTTAADAAISGSAVTSSGGTRQVCQDYGSPGSTNDDGDGTTVHAPAAGQGVYNLATGAYLGNVATVTSANAFTLTGSPGNASGLSLMVSSYGGCGAADYFGGSIGVSTGTPSAAYWDNCLYGGARNVTVSGNSFQMNSATVTGCTQGSASNFCGVQYQSSFNPGIPALLTYWASMQSYISLASAGLGDVWSGNAYTWTGTGAWEFTAGNFANNNNLGLTFAQWRGTPDFQDAGSTSS